MIMAKDDFVFYSTDKRKEKRERPKKYHSVEMKLSSLPIYLFKLKDISPHGACFLVKDGSAILKHLRVGLKMNMRYHSEEELEPADVFKSEVKYVTKYDDKTHKGHYLVGILILDKQDPDCLQDDS
jgi:hypothetical protein